MSTTPSDVSKLRENALSARWAHRSGEPWTAAEDEVILDYWMGADRCDRDERGISELLERTIEACRDRAHTLRRVLGLSRPERTVTTVTVTRTETVYRGWKEGDGDGWD